MPSRICAFPYERATSETSSSGASVRIVVSSSCCVTAAPVGETVSSDTDAAPPEGSPIVLSPARSGTAAMSIFV